MGQSQSTRKVKAQSWNGSNFIYEKKKVPGATFKVTAGADIYKADRTKVYNAGDVVAESLTTGTDGQVVLSDLHLGTYVVTEMLMQNQGIGKRGDTKAG